MLRPSVSTSAGQSSGILVEVLLAAVAAAAAAAAPAVADDFRVFVCDVNDARLEHIRHLNATHSINT